jgi:crotonobetainyl-CoA:carnitine CoA-transferase CaiB-like acyl-CoA transferase
VQAQAVPVSEVTAIPGVRVLELGERLGVAAAGLALVALGADVVQVRLPNRRVSSAERVYYDRGRVTVDGTEPLGELSRGADVVLTDLPDPELVDRGLAVTTAELRAGDTPQVLVSIRSLGRTGPNAALRMTDLTEWAAGGLASVTRRLHPDDPERYVPVVPPGFQPQALAGLAAATAVLAARRWALARGEAVIADVSVQEVVAATLHSVFPPFVWYGQLLGHPSTPTNALGLLLPAADGDVYVRTVEAHQWEALVDWVGDPDLHLLGRDPDQRLANLAAVRAVIAEWSVQHGRTELLVEGQRRKVAIALPRSLPDVLAWPHLRARDVWRTVDDDGTPGEIPRLPVIEPGCWAATRASTVGAIAERWSMQ